MKIGIDARNILSPSNEGSTGNAHYVFQLTKTLISNDTKNQYILFCDHKLREKDRVFFDSRDNVTIALYPFSRVMKFMPGLYNELAVSALYVKHKLDVLHVPSSAIRIPVSYRGKVVITVHDLAVYKSPESFSKVFSTRLRTIKALSLKQAVHIIVPSQTIKEEVMKIFNTPKDQISVVQTGLDQRFYAEKMDSGKKVAKRFGVAKKYILLMGMIEPAKNITRLMHAFALFQGIRKSKSDKDRSDYQLLITGKSGWQSQEIKNFVSDIDLDQDVKFSGYVIGDEVLPLLQHAEFVVIPSLFEGFGMVMLEAFAAGVPVIASNTGSLPEMADGAAMLVDPADTKALADAISEMASDKELRQSYAKKGMLRSRDFSWERNARETMEIYKKVTK